MELVRQRVDLKKKYPPEKMRAIRKLFSQDVQWWSAIKKQSDLDIQCITTDTGDPSVVAGPWPPQEWADRHAIGNERPCLHEDVLTQYVNQVDNQIQLNPMGIEVQPSGDGADEKSAEFVENRIRHWEYEEKAQLAVQNAASCAIRGSYGWFKLESAYASRFNRKVCIETVLDPNTIVPGFFKKPDCSDMRRAWEVERMANEEHFDRFGHKPSAAFVQGDATLAEDMGVWQDDTTCQVVAWWHLESDERELLRLQDNREVYADEVSTGPALDESQVVNRRMERRNKVVKSITNGLEVLKETEFEDPGEDGVSPEIPIFGVFGRIKFEDGKMTIESLIRKGRVGQLLYDSCISSIQEEISQTPKAKAWGPEGSFDTSTPWKSINRSPIAFAEWKLVYGENGELAQAPEHIAYQPQLQALELAKDSILRGIQNAIGMSAVERKDKVAKSGKALDQLKQEMTVGTAHYFGAVKIAQERMYRMLCRVLPDMERGMDQVGQRDKFGKNKIVPMPENAYRGRHSVTIGSGRLYQSLQEKQEEFADELVKVGGDPAILIIALMGAAKMRGLGPYGDEIHDALEALLSVQYPQVTAAMNQDEQQPIPPEAMQAITQMKQQLQALNEHAKALETQVIELEEDIKAQKIKADSDQKISADDNSTRIELERMKIDAQFALKNIELEIKKLELEKTRISGQYGLLGKTAEIGSKERVAHATMGHESTEAERDRTVTVDESERNRQFEKENRDSEE